MLFDRKAGRALVISAFVLHGLLLMGSSCSVVGDDYDELLSLKRLADHEPTPVWWKDGSRIAFAVPPEGVYVVDPGAPDRLPTFPRGTPVGTCGDQGNFSPALSPDGSRVAYVAAKSDGRSEIMTAAIDGSDARRLTKEKGVHAHPTWSPDGTRIAFMSGGLHKKKDLHVMDADGSNVRMIAPADYAYPPAWSPDGSRIAFVARDEQRNRNVYTVRPDGSGLVEIGKTQGDPVWSPDGSRLAFIGKNLQEAATKWDAVPDMRLVVVDLIGNVQQQWTFYGVRSRWQTALSWSPDGSKIVHGTGLDFAIVSADGTGTPVEVWGDRGEGLDTAGGGRRGRRTVRESPSTPVARCLPRRTTGPTGGYWRQFWINHPWVNTPSIAEHTRDTAEC